jgi:hypothetical protein
MHRDQRVNKVTVDRRREFQENSRCFFVVMAPGLM